MCIILTTFSPQKHVGYESMARFLLLTNNLSWLAHLLKLPWTKSWDNLSSWGWDMASNFWALSFVRGSGGYERSLASAKVRRSKKYLTKTLWGTFVLNWSRCRNSLSNSFLENKYDFEKVSFKLGTLYVVLTHLQQSNLSKFDNNRHSKQLDRPRLYSLTK